MKRSKSAPRPNKAPSHVRRVRVLIDTATSWGRNIISGIHRHFRSDQSWEILLEARGAEELLAADDLSECDGVIARIAGNRLNDRLKASGLPVVNVSGICLREDHSPRICTDLDAGAKMAALYFKEKGFEHFGYFSSLDLPFVRSQQAAFSRHVKLLGGHCSLPGSRGGDQRLLDWLANQPKPLALLTWNAAGAQIALRACQGRGLKVPEEVAILCGTDDDLLCEISHIPISGIQVSGEEIGFKSAQLLERLLSGGRPPRAPLLLPPVRVVSRLSTQILAVSDPQLVKALEFIREKAFGSLAVDDISRHAGLSRRMLERRFASLLKRTPAEQIRHVRISKAEELLTKTNLSIPEVAAASGFGSPEYMAFVFRESVDVTPLQYRKRYRV